MTIHIHATYRDGAIHPDHPLGLPDNTEVNVVIVPVESECDAPSKPQAGHTTERPKSPRITPEEFDALIKKHAVHVASLPVDFSREDIYSDHD